MARVASTIAVGLTLGGVGLLVATAVAHADGFRGDHDQFALVRDLESAGDSGPWSNRLINVQGHIADEACGARAEGVSSAELVDDDIEVTGDSRALATQIVFFEEFHFCPDQLPPT